jgi:hypothetical protein
VQEAAIQSEADAPLAAAQASAASQPVGRMVPKASQSTASAIPVWNAQAEQSIEV